MKGIGGNITGEIQISTYTTNEIGERIPKWETIQSIKGWLDYLSGEASRVNYSAKIQESTHVFVSDYVQLDSRIETESSRMVVKGKTYDITLIDNPMELDKQLEIYLKFTGGQS
ncbi:head-tail adaptor protein [Listeria monocytogenes]